MSLNQTLYPLGECISLFGGGTPSKDKSEFWNGDIPWASVKDLVSSRLTSTQDSISALGLASSSSKIVKAGSIILATRMAVGRVAIADMDVAINQDLKAITCSDRLNTKYLFYFLKSQESYFNKNASGATVQGIKINHILDIKIPLAPLAEQQKIAAILDAADSLRQKDQQLVERYTALSQSLFWEMFGDPVTNPMGWQIDKLRNVIRMFGGGTPSKDIDEYWGGNIPWATVKDLKSSTLLSTQDSITKRGLDNSSSKIVKAGTLIMATRMAVGRVVKAGIDVAINQDLKAIVCTDALINEFLFSFLVSKESYFNSISSGATVKGIKINDISELTILLPPLELQKKFAKAVSLIEAQKQQAQRSLEKSEALFNSLLQRAFTGELTKVAA